MYLRKIEISGFKSFAGKYKLDFEPGIVGIVGPNGSGKSNVADAIRWVLGEQSYKTIRAKKSEDVIFAGSQKRSRGSLAQVTLLLSDNQKSDLSDYSEIEISRRIYREGESEYYLNGNKVRLFEILELLARSGFGRSSYSVIGQGMVEQLLFLGAEERKSFFSEAAGIKQYEMKRDQSEKKLEMTEQNLIRISDITKELEPRLRVLKSQIKKAEARSEILSELNGHQRTYYESCLTSVLEKLNDKKQNEIGLKKEAAKIISEIESLNNEILEIENGINNKNEEVSGLRKILEERNKNRENKVEEKIILKSKIERLSDTLNLTDEGLTDELKKLELKEGECKRQLEDIQKNQKISQRQIVIKETELAELEEKKQKKKEEAKTKVQDLESKIRSTRIRIEELKKKRLGIETNISDFSKNESKRAQIKERKERAEEKHKILVSQIIDVKKELEMLSGSLDKGKANLKKAEKEIEETEKILRKIKDSTKFSHPELSLRLSEVLNEITVIETHTGDISSDQITKILSTLFGIKDKIKKIITWADPDTGKSQLENLETKLERSLKLRQEAIKENDEIEFRVVKANRHLEDSLSEAERMEKTIMHETEEIKIVSDFMSDIESNKKELNKIADDISIYEEEMDALQVRQSELDSFDTEEYFTCRELIFKEIEKQRMILSELILGQKINENAMIETKKEISLFTQKKKDIINAQGQKKTLISELGACEKEILSKEKEIGDLKTQISLFEQNHEDKVTLASCREKILAKQNLEREIQEEISLVKIEMAKLETKKDDIEYEAKKEIGSNFILKKADINLSKDALELVEQKIEKLKLKVMSIGEVDPLTKEEYEEVSTRYEFLENQLADLLKAKEDLSKVILELDKQIKTKFDTSFAKIAANFTKYFQILFSGGKAELKLEDGNVEIIAQPPGKRILGINALSGGERTLTSLSLIAAIMEVNPSPFVVMDEVDAALDEANTERFLKIIKELSKKTQFIFITHNRGTMKIADILYGVTMDANNISSLLSIRLEGANS
ncbi:MAG: Chromosome partition protein Smc [candidate division CPR2 bacterium GW2011_GWC1_39_9]|uniref:Chromosome partition protein Smc n=1 Tax=candidate division CPR2 bacterium GW2011_GWC2_39_10 TaxID=1618345 RepID=A0A0G0LQ82_UNCC2|nr:MAG: Chromosome partition protein Smc [candidate division CPR2 bacterium GW2011_GWC2_39_10]KKR33493.1 MAG: Chromosome partition protein Smc [candidate division CPR2 bacterium GW2011_GWC1_39_9]